MASIRAPAFCRRPDAGRPVGASVPAPLAAARLAGVSPHLGRAALVSFGLHGLVLVLLLLRFTLLAAPAPPPGPLYAQVELIQEKTPAVGGAPKAPRPQPAMQAAPVPPPPPAAPAAQTAAQVPPVPPLPAALPLPAPAPRTPPQPQPLAQPAPPEPPAPPAPPPAPAPAAPPPAPQSPPEVNLALTGEIGTGIVGGTQVIPAKIDPGFHNLPPIYPEAAAERGEHGVVSLLIHVAPDGSAASVEIEHSSGYPLLDRTAREAVLRWHFRPAEKDGIPQASVLPFDIHFDLYRRGIKWSG